MDRKSISAIRFGNGFYPGSPVPVSVDELLGTLAAPDIAFQESPPWSFEVANEGRLQVLHAYKAMKASAEGELETAQQHYNTMHETFDDRIFGARKSLVYHSIFGPHQFRERLVSFWLDHFTVSAAASRFCLTMIPCYVSEAIRPNIAGRFSDMVEAIAYHPAMVLYLDQWSSIGPNSVTGKHTGRGLNENFARELLELHTLGVGASYTQKDVRQLAFLLTGIQFNGAAVSYNETRAEPGIKTILGKQYGPETSTAEISRFFHDLTARADTARHIAGKLVSHFVSPDPDPGHVDAVAAAFHESGGNLMAVYRALLEHPAAWQPVGKKIRLPLEYIVSAFRALGISRERFNAMSRQETEQFIEKPLAAMGQPILSPPGPDGWPEHSDKWITSDGLATRLSWALMVCEAFGEGIDPRDFMEATLGNGVTPELRKAVAGAPSRSEGLMMTLAAPAFNRR